MRIEFDSFVLDTDLRQLTRDGQAVHLTPKAFQLLEILALERPRPVPKQLLHDRLWPDTHVDEGSLKSLVAQIRGAVGDDVHHPTVIRTVHRFGYAFSAEPNDPSPALDEVAPARRPRRAWLVGALGAIVVAAVAAAVLFTTWSDVPRRADSAVPLIRAIAVLPLGNASGEPEHDRFATCLTEALTNELSKNGISVVSSMSMRQYRGTAQRPSVIARELDVDAVVAGSVLHNGSRVRVSAELVHGVSGRNIWAATHEADTADVLAAHRELAGVMAEEIAAHVVTAPRAVDRRAP